LKEVGREGGKEGEERAQGRMARELAACGG